MTTTSTPAFEPESEPEPEPEPEPERLPAARMVCEPEPELTMTADTASNVDTVGACLTPQTTTALHIPPPGNETVSIRPGGVCRDEAAVADTEEPVKSIAAWTTSQVLDWLGKLGMGEASALWSNIFEFNEVDGRDLSCLTNEDLQVRHGDKGTCAILTCTSQCTYM